jgi:hypothetical protein
MFEWEVSTTSRWRVGPYGSEGVAFTHPLPRGGTDFMGRYCPARGGKPP